MKNNFENANNIALSGYKILKLLNMLTISPCDKKEINQSFLKDKLISKEMSDDTICLYINTLKKVGCKISRPKKSNNNKYIMTHNPFNFTISEKENEMLGIVLKHLAKMDDWKFILEVDDVFQELKTLSNLKKDDFLTSLSNITSIDKQIILKLQNHCRKKNVITIFQTSSQPDIKKKTTILADELFLENEKLYIWGYNFDFHEMQYFRLDRIYKVKKIGISENTETIMKKPTARYKIKNELTKTFKIDENKKIISKNSDEIIVEEEIVNKFKFIQTILSYGKNCILISPKDIVEEITLTLESLEEIYGK